MYGTGLWYKQVRTKIVINTKTQLSEVRETQGVKGHYLMKKSTEGQLFFTCAPSTNQKQIGELVVIMERGGQGSPPITDRRCKKCVEKLEARARA